MVTGRDGESGVSVSVITLQEQEHGTEPELAPTLLLLALEGKSFKYNSIYIRSNNPFNLFHQGVNSLAKHERTRPGAAMMICSRNKETKLRHRQTRN